MQSLNQVKGAISYISDLNSAQTNISVVTGMQIDKVQQLTDSYSALAKQLGADNEEMNKGAEIYLRAGLNGKDAADMLTQNTIASKLSGVGSEDMSNYLISIKNGFHLETSAISEVVDALSTLDNKSSTSFSDISEAMQHSSASSNQVGVSWQKLASYISVVSDVTHKSAETIGESYKTIFTRMTSVKAGMVDEDNMGINNVEKVLDRQGIKLRESSGEWRNMGNVISDVAAKWKSMDSVSQSQVSNAMAGTRQAETFLTLMQNWDKEQGYEADTLNSQGSALDRYQTYLQSTDAKLNILKTTLHDVYSAMVNSGEINNVVGIFTGFVGVLALVVKTFGAIPTIAGVIGVAISLLNAKWMLLNVSMAETGGIQFSGLLKNAFMGVQSTITNVIASYNTLIGVETAENGFTAAADPMKRGLGTAFKALTLGIDGATIAEAAMTVGSMALNMALTMGLSFAITAIIGALSSFVSGISEANQKQKEALQTSADSAKKYEDESKSIQDLTSQYGALSASGLTDEDTKSKLLSIQTQLITSYGNEAKGLDLVNGKYQDQIDKLQKLNKQKSDDWIRSNQEGISNAKNTLSKTDTSSFGDNFGEDFGENGENRIKALLYNNSGVATDEGNGIGNTYQITGNLEKRVSVLKEILDASNKINNRNAQEQNYVNKISNEYNTLKSSMDSAQSTVGKMFNAQLMSQYSDKITQITADMSTMGSSDSNVANKATKDFQMLFASMESSIGNNTDLKKAFEDWINGLDSTGKAAKGATPSITDFATSMGTLTKQMSTAKSAISDVNAVLDKHTKSNEWDLDAILKLSASYPELLGCLGDDKAMTEELTKIKETEKNTVVNSLQTQINANDDTVEALGLAYGRDVRNKGMAEEAKNEAVKKAINDRIDMYKDEMKATNAAMANDPINGESYASDQNNFNYLISQAQADLASVNTVVNTYNKLNAVKSNLDKYLTSAGSSGNDGTSGNSGTSAATKAQRDYVSEVKTLRSDLASSIKASLEAEKKQTIDTLTAEKKAIQDRYDTETALITQKKNALSDQQDAEGKQEALNKENTTLSDLQTKYNSLGLNTDISTQSAKTDLLKQINAQKQVIADMLNKNNYDAQNKNLDNQQKSLEAQKKLRDDAFTQQETDINNKYEILESDAATFAKADALMASNAQQQILNLLMQYKPDYASVGQSLGQSMSEAMLLEINKGLSAMPIVQANGGVNPNDSSSSSSSSSGNSYTVKSGDSLRSIAQNVGETWQTLYNKNKSVIGNDPTMIQPGMVLQYKEGGDVNQDGLIFAHNKEGVLTVEQNMLFKTFIDKLPNIMPSFNIPTMKVPNINNRNSNLISLNIDNLIKVTGSVDKNALPSLQGIADYTVDKLVNRLRLSGVPV